MTIGRVPVPDEEMLVVSRCARPADPIGVIVRGTFVEVDGDRTLLEVAEGLAATEIGALLVRDPHGVVGLVSQRDLAVVLSGGRDLDEVRVSEVMAVELVWSPPSATIREVGELMRDAEVRHVAVGDGCVALGVVTVWEILNVLLDSAT